MEGCRGAGPLCLGESRRQLAGRRDFVFGGSPEIRLWMKVWSGLWKAFDERAGHLDFIALAALLGHRAVPQPSRSRPLCFLFSLPDSQRAAGLTPSLP